MVVYTQKKTWLSQTSKAKEPNLPFIKLMYRTQKTKKNLTDQYTSHAQYIYQKQLILETTMKFLTQIPTNALYSPTNLLKDHYL